jgi:hypothetical protein
MARVDLEEFYALVAVGDRVELIGERNEETARLFGDVEKPVTPAQPVLMAMAAPAAAPTAVTAKTPEIPSTQPGNPGQQLLIAAR